MPGTESHFIRAKGSIHQEDLTILKLDGPDNKASKCVTHKQTKSPSAHGRPAPPEPREAWTRGGPSAVPRPRMVLDVRCVLVFSQPWFSGTGQSHGSTGAGNCPCLSDLNSRCSRSPRPTGRLEGGRWGVPHREYRGVPHTSAGPTPHLLPPLRCHFPREATSSLFPFPALFSSKPFTSKHFTCFTYHIRVSSLGSSSV